MEKKYIIFVVFASVAQSALGSRSSKAIDIQNGISSSSAALEVYNNIATLETRRAINIIFGTIRKCSDDLKTRDRNKTEEFLSSVEIAQDETTVALIGELESTWTVLIDVEPGSLHKITSLRKLTSYKVKEMIENIYSARTLACGKKTERTLSRIETHENMVIAGIIPLISDIYSPFSNEDSDHLLIESYKHAAASELLRGCRGIFTGIKALYNEGGDADYAIQAAHNQALSGFMAELEIKYSFFRTVLVAHSLIKAGSLGKISPVQPHSGSESSEFENVIIDISTIIDEYLTKISHVNETANKTCGSQNFRETSLADLITGVKIIFNWIKTAFTTSTDIDNEDATNNHLDTNDIDRHKVSKAFKRSIEALFNIIPKSDCESSSACMKKKRGVFVSMNLVIDGIYDGMRLAQGQNSTKSELEIDATEEKVISQTSECIKGILDVLRNSHQYQPQMEPIIQFMETSVFSKFQTAWAKTFVAIRILNAKHSFKNKIDNVGAGSLTIGMLDKETSFALQSQNAILFYTMQNLYRANPSDKEAIVSRLCEIESAISFSSAERKRGIDLFFATIQAFLPGNCNGYQNKTPLETRSSNSFSIETTMKATFDAFEHAYDAILIACSMILPEAPAPITSGRALLYNKVKNAIRDIYKAIILAKNSHSSETLVEIENIQEKVTFDFGKMGIEIFTAIKNCRPINPGMRTGFERAKKMLSRELLESIRPIFDGIKALHTATSAGTQVGNKDPFSVIETAHLKALSAVNTKAITEYEIMITLFTSCSSYRTKTEVDSCTTIST